MCSPDWTAVTVYSVHSFLLFAQIAELAAKVTDYDIFVSIPFGGGGGGWGRRP